MCAHSFKHTPTRVYTHTHTHTWQEFKARLHTANIQWNYCFLHTFVTFSPGAPEQSLRELRTTTDHTNKLYTKHKRKTSTNTERWAVYEHLPVCYSHQNTSTEVNKMQRLARKTRLSSHREPMSQWNIKLCTLMEENVTVMKKTKGVKQKKKR